MYDVEVYIPIDQSYRDMVPFGTKILVDFKVIGDIVHYTLNDFQAKWASIFGIVVRYTEDERSI